MKRIIVLCLSVCLLYSVTGCKGEVETAAPEKPKEPVVVEPEIKVPDSYYAARDFSEGLAWVSRGYAPPSESGEPAKFYDWEVIDNEGKTVFVLEQGTPVSDFSHGVAVMNLPTTGDPTIDSRNTIGEKTYCNIIDTTGKVVFPREGDENNYNYLGIFSNGMTFVSVTTDTAQTYEQRNGIVDSDGNWILEPRKDFKPKAQAEGYESDFGMIPVSGYENYDYYDTANKKFLAFTSDESADRDKEFTEWMGDRLYSDGMVLVNILGGTEVFGPSGRLNWMGFKAPAEVAEGGYNAARAFYDTNRNMVIPLFSLYGHYSLDAAFNDGYCALQVGPQGPNFAVIIDKTGREMFTPIKNAEIYPYSNGLSMFKGEGDSDFSYIDIAGEKVITGVYEGYPFNEDGVARVIMQENLDPNMGNPHWTFINKDGSVAFYKQSE